MYYKILHYSLLKKKTHKNHVFLVCKLNYRLIFVANMPHLTFFQPKYLNDFVCYYNIAFIIYYI